MNNTLRWFRFRLYEAWIDENVPLDEMDTNCAMWARVMNTAFPELVLVGGSILGDHSFFTSLNHSYHEYLIDPDDGTIIDPTRNQFDRLFGGKDAWVYERWEEHLIYHESVMNWNHKLQNASRY